MKVTELIDLLKTMPPDAEVSAYDTTNCLMLIMEGGVTLEEPGEFEPFYADGRVLVEGEGSAYYPGQHVAIVGGSYTHRGPLN